MFDIEDGEKIVSVLSVMNSAQYMRYASKLFE